MVVQQWSHGDHHVVVVLSRTCQAGCLLVVHRLAASIDVLTKTALHFTRLAVDSFNSSRAQTLCDGFRRNMDSVIQKCWRMQYNVLVVTN